MTVWRKYEAEDFAVGPETVLPLTGGRTAMLRAFWDGESVSVQVDPGEEPLPREDAEALGVALIQMAATPSPDETPC
jgi:hypothetical protein